MFSNVPDGLPRLSWAGVPFVLTRIRMPHPACANTMAIIRPKSRFSFLVVFYS